MWIWERFAFGKKKKAKNDPNSAYSKYRFAMFRVNYSSLEGSLIAFGKNATTMSQVRHDAEPARQAAHVM